MKCIHALSAVAVALVLAGCGRQGGSATATTASAPAARSGAVAATPVGAAASPSAGAANAAHAAASATPAVYRYDAAAGKQKYFVTCSVCHQANGTGMAGVFPPLKGNPVVTSDDPTRQITTVLHGVSGPLTVLGSKYNGTMPAFGAKLSDVDVANIINYERSSWGNHSRPATPEQVAAARAGTGGSD